MADERPPGFRLQLSVVSERLAPEGSFPAAGVLLSEPMRRFRCNEKGCCCSGWDIPFQLEDFLRLHERFDETDRAQLTKQLKLVVEPPKDGGPIDAGERVLQSIKLNGVGDDKHCRFLTGHGGCGVQEKYGVEALPDLCVDFPAFGYRQPDGPAELFFDPICPEVLERLDESDAPLRLHHQPASFENPMLDLRARHATMPVQLSVEGAGLVPAPAFVLRNACIEAFARPRPPWKSLQAVLEAIRGLKSGDRLNADWPPEPGDPLGFLHFLNACLGAHSAELLVVLFQRYQRFVFAIDLAPVLAQREVFLHHLEDFRPAFGEWLAAQEEKLAPLWARWLAHRFSAPFVTQKGDLRMAADAITHRYGTALRIAAALGATLQRPVDRAILKVAIGASEFFYRSLHLPRQSLPWYCAARLELEPQPPPAGAPATP